MFLRLYCCRKVLFTDFAPLPNFEYIFATFWYFVVFILFCAIMSSLKLDCDRLNKDELVYELKIRGLFDVGNVQEMRSCLRKILKMEQTGETLTYPKYDLDCVEEFQTIDEKIQEVKAMISGLNTGPTSGPYKKIEAKIAHLVKRIDRTISKDEATAKQRSQLFAQILDLSSALEKRLEELVNADISIIDAGLSDVNLASIDQQDFTSTRISSPANEHHSPSIKSIPVVKWNLTFSGDLKEMSVSAFLERIEELCIARHVSKRELFDSAIDLFRGQALIWFRANRTEFANWDSLSKELKKQFQPHDYDERLFDEIKRRTQGRDEPIGIYLAVMTNLFSRLSFRAPEATRLKILMKNIDPFFQLNLGLTEITSVDDLKKMCARLEEKSAV